MADRLIRVAHMGDGWLAEYETATEAQEALEQLDRYLNEVGRTRSDIGLEPQLSYRDQDPDRWARTIEDWQAAGATHITLNTQGCGLSTPKAHLLAMRTFAEAISLA